MSGTRRTFRSRPPFRMIASDTAVRPLPSLLLYAS